MGEAWRNQSDWREFPASHSRVMYGQGESWNVLETQCSGTCEMPGGSFPAGLRTEGLFRRSASVQAVHEIQRLYNQGEWAPRDPSGALQPAMQLSRASEP